jgi:hypothetical protein
MDRMQIVVATLLACSGALVVAGVAMMHVPAGLIAGGIALGLWTWLVLTEPER